MAKKGRAAARPRESAANTAQSSSWLSRRVPVGIILVAINLFIYAAVYRFQLVNWDDSTYVTENPTVLGGLSWSSAWWALTTGHSPYWHPLTWLSHLLDVTLFGTDAGMYHLTSLLLHIANTLLVFELFRRLTGAGGRSAFVAAIFAAHPLHVESVAWIAERKDVLSTFFWLLTMLAYDGYVRDRSWRRYAVMLLFYALALMSKPMVVTLPAVLLLLDIWPLRRMSASAGEDRREETWARLVMEKVPLFALALATSVATVVIQHRVGAMAGLDALPWTVRAANATIGYVAYLWKTIWPTHLAAFYPLFTISPARVGAAAAVLIAVTAAVLAERRRRPYLLTGWGWYVITIAPVIGLLQAGEQGMADRFMYIPMIGILVMAAWGLPELVAAISIRTWLLPAGASVLVVACAIAARAQAAHWEDSVTLWQHATRVTPESYIAHENLGQALRERGQLDEAEASYERAIVHAPPRSPAYLAVIHNSLGMVLTRKDQPRQALEHFAAAVRLSPNFAEAQGNLGNALVAAGRWPDAIGHYREAVRLKPGYTEPRVGLGGALLKEGRAAEAIPEYREALRLDPGLAEAHNGLGAALATEGHDAEAMIEYTEALRLKPDLPTAHLNVAVLFVKKGDLAQARRHLQEALAIDPNYTPAKEALRAIGAQGE